LGPYSQTICPTQQKPVIPSLLIFPELDDARDGYIQIDKDLELRDDFLDFFNIELLSP